MRHKISSHLFLKRHKEQKDLYLQKYVPHKIFIFTEGCSKVENDVQDF